MKECDSELAEENSTLDTIRSLAGVVAGVERTEAGKESANDYNSRQRPHQNTENRDDQLPPGYLDGDDVAVRPGTD